MSFRLSPDLLAQWINLLSPDDLAQVKKDLRKALVRDQVNDDLQQILGQPDDNQTPSSKSARG